jgi:hypothetical protein
MKRLLGMILAAGLGFGSVGVAADMAMASTQENGIYPVTPVVSKCIWYHSHYYCIVTYYQYGCIWYHNYPYCPATPPYSGGGGGSSY